MVPTGKRCAREDSCMGLRSWLRERARRSSERRQVAEAREVKAKEAPRPREIAPGFAEDEWQELPAYIPVDPEEHRVACVIAAAIAAGDRPESEMKIRRVSMANSEYRRVACIATAIGAGALEESSFKVRRIYKKKDMEKDHAA